MSLYCIRLYNLEHHTKYPIKVTKTKIIEYRSYFWCSRYKVLFQNPQIFPHIFKFMWSMNDFIANKRNFLMCFKIMEAIITEGERKSYNIAKSYGPINLNIHLEGIHCTEITIHLGKAVPLLFRMLKRRYMIRKWHWRLSLVLNVTSKKQWQKTSEMTWSYLIHIWFLHLAK